MDKLVIQFGKLFFIIIIFTAINFQSGQAKEENVDSNTMNLISQSTSYFTSDLYNALSSRKADSGNVVFSPYSLSSLLTMLKAGARGATEKEILSALRLQGLDEKTVYKGYHDLLQSLKQYETVNNGVTLKAANTIFTDEKFTVKQSYLDILRNYFESEGQTVKFAENKAAASKINQWVSLHTNAKINDLIKAESLSEDTKAILVNAIYFKGDWKLRFDPELTKQKPFYYNSTTEDHVMMDFMETESALSYGKVKELEATAVSIPYKGEQIVLCIVLPNNASDFSEFEQRLRGFDLSRIPIELPSFVPVNLSIPKFKMESTIDFVDEEILQKLGIKTVLGKGENAPDLTNLAEKSASLRVSSVIQKSFIEINEEGTEAFGAGHINIGTKILRPPKPAVFQANRPFFAFVFDFETKSILFLLRKMK